MKTKKSSLSLVLALLMLFVASVASAALTPNADGVYEIRTEAQLQEFREMVNGGQTDIDAKLIADIVLTENWQPIGYYDAATTTEYYYTGSFDGNGHTISGLTMTNEDTLTGSYSNPVALPRYPVAGLFGVTDEGAEIKDLTLANVSIDLGPLRQDGTDASKIAGSLIGVMEGGEVTGVSVVGGNMTAASLGGLIGRINDGGMVANSSVSGMGTLKLYRGGGFVGDAGAPTILNCHVSNIELIDGVRYFGGFAGAISPGSLEEPFVSNCSVVSVDKIIMKPVANDNSRAFGGFVGSITSYASASGPVAVMNCKVENVGSISWNTQAPEAATGTVRAGGFVGDMRARVMNCTVSGIDEIKGKSAGGFVATLEVGPGHYAMIENCSVSDVDLISGTLKVGAFAADNYRGNIKNCIAGEIGTIESTGSTSSSTAGALVGTNNGDLANNHYATVRNSILLAGETPTTVSTNVGATYYSGGVLGTLTGAGEAATFAENLAQLTNCLYPSNLVFANGKPERAIGNVLPANMDAALNVRSYNVDDDELPAIAAEIVEGYTFTILVGETLSLNVKTYPGESAEVVCGWSSDEETVADVTAGMDGYSAQVTAVSTGMAYVTAKVRGGGIEADLIVAINVVEEVTPVVTGNPADGLIFPNDEVDLTYAYSPYKVIGVDNTGMQTDISGLIADILAGKVVVTGVAKASGSYYYDVTLQGANGETFTQRVYVVIQGGSRPTGDDGNGTRGGGSSSCNAGVGAALFALLGLAFIQKRK
ncbi:hypothetical protein LJC40_03630 [Synergistaceae bacterium OttesenSCG-928-D05]|nr:hypothetical protein [Synergistaceae bacterium OttesenSCG-928-D05]